MLDRLLAQFSGPRGALGHVAGILMARQNRALNAWVASLLEVGPEDRVVEVGFGPGLAVAANAAAATRGLVAGVDRSAVMLRHASRRNGAAIRSGRVDLRLGDATALPFGDGSFTRGLAINSLQFWQPPEAGLRELARVLAPGARLVLAQRLWNPAAGRLDRSRFGMRPERVEEIGKTLESLGFGALAMARREIRGETLAALCTERMPTRRR